jgi:hypothetical protein
MDSWKRTRYRTRFRRYRVRVINKHFLGYGNERLFSVSPTRRYVTGNPDGIVESRVEAGTNTSTVALRVVGGDENGSLESETVKYGRASYGTRTRE